jgi:hypothetical protein
MSHVKVIFNLKVYFYHPKNCQSTEIFVTDIKILNQFRALNETLEFGCKALNKNSKKCTKLHFILQLNFIENRCFSRFIVIR